MLFYSIGLKNDICRVLRGRVGRVQDWYVISFGVHGSKFKSRIQPQHI